MSYIYALTDPRTNEIRYIGKTTNSLNRRLNDHISESKRENTTHKQRWIVSLLKKDLRPNIILLEQTSPELINEREIYHIQNNDNLTNGTYGGDGGTEYWTEESIEKLRTSNKTKWTDLEHREERIKKMKGVKKSDTSKMVERQNKLWADPNYTDKMRKAQSSCQEVIVDDIKYHSISEACRELGIKYKSTLIKRLKSKNFPNYKYGGE